MGVKGHLTPHGFSVSDCCQPHGCPLAHLEQIECWIKYPLDDLLQKLLKDSVLVDAGFIHPKVIDKLHSDHSLHGMLGKLPELLVAILPRQNFNCEERCVRKPRSLITQVRTPAHRRPFDGYGFSLPGTRRLPPGGQRVRWGKLERVVLALATKGGGIWNKMELSPFFNGQSIF